MTTVTAVIPTYNRAQWVSDAIRSALRQSHRPREILVIDDGSTDATAEICARFGLPVRCIRQAHAGVSVARNRGVREARGDYIAFLDSDDLWEPGKLEVHLAVHRALPHVGWSVSDCAFIGLDGWPLPPPQGFERAYPVFRDLHVAPKELFARAMAPANISVDGASRCVYVGDAFELLFEGNFVTPQCTVLARELCERVGRFDEAMLVAQDTEYFHRVAAVSPIAVIMEPLVRWRVGLEAHNTAPRNTVQLVRNAVTSVDRAATLRRPLPSTTQRAYQRGRIRLLLRLAYAHLSLLEGKAARSAVREAWRGGARRSLRSLAIVGASLLPPSVLRGLHAVKRALRF